MTSKKILIVDDDPIFLRTTKRLLETHGFEVETTGNPTEVIPIVSQKAFHCILTDLKMPAMDGIDILKALQKEKFSVPVIMISGEGTIHLAVESLKFGAYDFIEKPIDVDRLLNTIRNAIERQLLIEENEMLFKEVQRNIEIIGASPSFKKIFEMIQMAAQVDSKVLLTGESGTGKSLIARAIHFQSQRKARPLIEINCATLPGNLLESELFGYKKGAFTGAFNDKEGVFLAAHGGTVFLDEIGDMDLAMQAKLLKVLDTQEVPVIGSPIPQKIDVRIITATNRDIKQLIAEKKFRTDLYYRLKVIHIHIPPLRERKEDILPLAYHFLHKFRTKLNKPVTGIHPLLEANLKEYSFPGNVRELENLMERMVLFSQNDELKLEDFFHVVNADRDVKEQIFDWNNEPFIVPYQHAMSAFEEKYLRYALKVNGGNILRTAKALHLDRSNLYKKLHKYGI